MYNDGQLYFGRNGKSQPNKKTYLSEVKQGKTVGSLWTYKDVGSTHESNEELSLVLGKGVFDNPKGTRLIEQIIQIANIPDDGIILDSFAGSGTTAHAVLSLNNQDGGNRKFVLVECENYANKITAERVRHVIKGIRRASDERLKKGLGGSFTYCTLGEAISIEKMLTGRKLPNYEALAQYIVYTITGRSPDRIRKTIDEDGFFYETHDRMFYLIYEPKLTFLRSPKSALDGDRAKRIALKVEKKKKKAIVFATHKFMGQKNLTEKGIVFCLLPYQIDGI